MEQTIIPKLTMSILVVDDTPANLRLVTGMLNELGYRVRSVSNGAFALQTARHNPPDLILLDVMMPEMDGYEVCKRLKADEQLAEIPVIFLSSLNETVDKVKAFEVGGVDYVTKPFQLRELQARVATHLELHRQKRLARESYAQLNAMNKEMESFSSAVSHDLRAPILRMSRLTQAFLEDYGDILDQQGRTYIEHTRDEAQRMGRLVDDLLELSRVTCSEISFCEVNLSGIAEQVSQRLREAEPERSIDFVIQPDVSVVGDPRLLEVVLTNLLGNAAKFTRKREQASIDFCRIEEGRATVFLVRDNGAGFDMDYADKLFTPFKRLHADSDYPGTGVGLATVQRIIRRHGGEVWADAQVDEGAKFWFTLPPNPYLLQSAAVAG